jgi:hypothetical protein
MTFVRRQDRFIDNYTNPYSTTFSNASRSATEAGYSESYAKNITHLSPEWISEYIGKSGVLDQAKENVKVWLSSEEEHLQPYKFKATELVLKMAEANTKEVDVLDKYLQRSSLTNLEKAKIFEICKMHNIAIPRESQNAISEARLREIDAVFIR